MLNNLNARERTLPDFQSLLADCGWKLAVVRKNAGNKMWWPTLVSIPAWPSDATRIVAES